MMKSANMFSDTELSGLHIANFFMCKVEGKRADEILRVMTSYYRSPSWLLVKSKIEIGRF